MLILNVVDEVLGALVRRRHIVYGGVGLGLQHLLQSIATLQLLIRSENFLFAVSQVARGVAHSVPFQVLRLRQLKWLQAVENFSVADEATVRSVVSCHVCHVKIRAHLGLCLLLFNLIHRDLLLQEILDS